MKQIYHNYLKLEDINSGMYEQAKNNKERIIQVNNSVKVLSNLNMFKLGIEKLFTSWIYSCEHNLTNMTQNRKSWLGQAACYIYIGSVEQSTRESWWILTDKQKESANKLAQQMIEKWENEQCLKSQLELMF